ncbi:hypothetical protein [Thermus sp.]|uniref:hypothetical protein n=1 Tax=Thermus sp. TaxID=275 RepID=UPI0025E15F0C|nr:hypothetical protein [Thermus sp.]MCS6868619.1 hypothetical protein [Thermus sp.]MDW8358933.1 hypothetical protein [Thermus sp.]
MFLAAGVGHLEGLALLLRGAALEVGVAFPPPALVPGLLVPFSASELGETYRGGGATLWPGEGFLASAYLGFPRGREAGQDLFWYLGQALLGERVFLVPLPWPGPPPPGPGGGPPGPPGAKPSGPGAGPA